MGGRRSGVHFVRTTLVRVLPERSDRPRDECVALGLFWRDSKQAGAQS